MKKFILMAITLITTAVPIFATIGQYQACQIGEKFARDTICDIMVTNIPYGEGDTIKTEGDYVVCPFDSAWCVFIDFYPLHDWRHECVYIFIRVNGGDILSTIKNTPPATICQSWTKYKTYKLPETEQVNHSSLLLERLQQQNSFSGASVSHAQQRLRLDSQNQVENYPTAYAIIISCALSAEYNYERYWNDCAIMYSTFLAHGFERENIFTAMGLGNDSLPDTRLNSGTLIVSPKDLDGDGTRDVRYPATEDGVYQLFDDMREIVDENDIVVVYINGLGDMITGISDPESCYGNIACTFFNSGHIFDYNIGYLIDRIQCGIYNVMVQRTLADNLATCIKQRLGEQQNSVFTYDIHSEVINYQYDKFTYDLVSALNDSTPDGVIVSADSNNDGHVSMSEVLEYLASHASPNSRYNQNSHPICLASQLTLESLDDDQSCFSSDLYIKDNYSDTGIEPNTSTSQSYISPDIWVEDLNGNVVDVLQSGETYYICAQIKNRGTIPSTGDEILHLHWTKAVIGGKWPDSWIEGATYNCSGSAVTVGGEITPTYGFPLPSIDTDETYIARVLWTTPDNADYAPCSEFVGNNNELWHYCLLARIYDEHETPGEDMTWMSMRDFVLGSNNVASRNITIMSQTSANMLTGVVGISVPYSGYFSLRGTRLNFDELPIGTGGLYITYTLSQNLMNSWSYVESGTQTIDWNTQQIISDTAILYNFYLYDSEMYSLKLDISGAPIGYMYDISLLDDEGFTIGGEIFQVSYNSYNLYSLPRRASKGEKSSANIINSIDPDIILAADDTHVIFKVRVSRAYVLGYMGNVISKMEDIDYLDISSLPTGIYIIVVETDQTTQQFIILKNK